MQFLVEAYEESSRIGSAAMRAAVGAEAERRGMRYVGTVRIPEDETAFHVFDAPDRRALIDLLSDARIGYNRVTAALATDVVMFAGQGEDQ